MNDYKNTLSPACIYHIALLISKEDVTASVVRYDKYIEFLEKGIKQLNGDILNIVIRFYNNFVEKHKSRKKIWDSIYE